MNRSLLALSLCALLAACGDGRKPPAAPPAPSARTGGADAVSEAAGSYEVRAGFSPASVARGGASTLAIEIVMRRPDVHVQSEFPLRVSLAPSAGLVPAKASLGHADALDPAAKGRRWEIATNATAAGAQGVTASLRFAICKEAEPAWCVTRNETLTAALDVR
ncbi:MAG TPA: hypothetical protein VLT47_10700 [Anaeromyxobacteraceae bacterium]|nr:hypothetical protein [Anaeromyxobacteraceae bacterium]